MRRLATVFAAVSLLVVCIVARAPAWVLVDQLTTRLPDVGFGEVSGRLWAGTLSSVAYRGVTVEQVEWEFQLLGLLSASALRISMGTPVAATAELGPGKDQTLVVSSLEAQGGVATLLSLAGLPSMGFDGVIEARLSGVLSASACESLDGSLTLRRITGDLPSIDSIAPVTATAACQGRNITLDVDENNPARIRGNIAIPMGRMPRGQLTVSPGPETELYNGLQQLLGRPRNNVDFVLRF